MYMPGTLDPEQQQQLGVQQALVDALRQQQIAPVQQQQAGQVVSAGALGDGMNTGAIGGALKNGFGPVGSTGDLDGTSQFTDASGMW